MKFEQICVIGLGYIGLPTAAVFASNGKQVIGVDINQHAVDTINRGEIHIFEPNLREVVSDVVKASLLTAMTTPVSADAFLITVPTPFKNNGSSIPEPDLKFIKAAARSIAPVLKKGDLIILESTSPVGTTEKLSEWLSTLRPDLVLPHEPNENSDINVAYCPERVLPGRILEELITNDRVIGGLTNACARRASELYKTFVKGDCIITNARTAEMTKLTENACRDVQIAFANELSVICDAIDIDVWELIQLANRHPRINILQPGPGVGGHCIAVDPWFIVSKTPEEANLIHAARKINDAKPCWVINKVKAKIAEYLKDHPQKSTSDLKIVCYGLAFKPDIDDLRESPAMFITRKLAKDYFGSILAVEPNIQKLNKEESFDLISAAEASQVADIAVMLVDHSEFKSMNKPTTNYVIDVKGMW